MTTLMLSDSGLVRAGIIKVAPGISLAAVDYLVGQWNARRIVIPVPPFPLSPLSIYPAPGLTDAEATAILATFKRLQEPSPLEQMTAAPIAEWEFLTTIERSWCREQPSLPGVLDVVGEAEWTCRGSRDPGARLVARGVPDAELVERAKRRRFTAEYKLEILAKGDACTRPGEIGALLRREGLYSSLLTEWRRARDAGSLAALERPRGRPKADPRDAQIAALKRRAERADIFADPQIAAHDAITTVDDPRLGAVRMQNVLFRLSQTPGAIRWTGTELGEHNAEVYGELGVEAPALAALRRAGVV